jgi:DNA-binding SARP family transcriptional activator/tetratricopeptide (TPR) repeat protein
VRFGVLGGLQAVDDEGRVIDLGGAQPRTVFAVLLTRPGRVATAEELIDAVWGEAPPASASGTLQTYISRLRRALDQPGRLLWEPPGYRLDLTGVEVDFLRFETLADEAREKLTAGDMTAVHEVLTEAEALWRGPALAEYRDRDFAMGLSSRLEARRLAAIEDRVTAELALGRHAAIVGELAELVNAYPLQEGLRAGYALALYRSGRQAEALRAIDDARRTLVDELGVDPGRQLQDLEVAILEHDPALDLPDAPRAPRTVATPTPTTAAEADEPAPTTTLVGRAHELREALDALHEAATATRAVIIEGEPGIGKTRLAEELVAEAQRRGATTLWGRAFEGGAAPTLWPWLPPLRALAAEAPSGTKLTGKLTQLLAPAGPDAGTPAAVEPARFALFEAVSSLLSACAAQRPVVLVLDDIQWADVASLELVRSIGDRLRDVPVMLVCTVRELEVGRNDAVVEALAALTRQPGTRRIRLHGLTKPATAELVQQTTGDSPSAHTMDAIYDRAEGNPFFATELARLLAAADAPGDRDIPSGVRDVVRRRLADLSDETVSLLQTAGVAGRDVDLGLLTRASGEDLDACLDRLDPALVQRLVIIDPDHPSVYRFAHALVREVVVDDLSPLKRARLHLKIADALPEDDDTVEIVAEHLWAAVPIGVGRRAADALERAARVATRRFSYAAAQDHLERAVQLRRAAGSSPEDLVAEAKAVTHLISVLGARQGRPALMGSPILARGKQLAQQAGLDVELLDLLWVEWAGLDLANRPEAHPIARDLLEFTSTHAQTPIAPVLGHTAYGISCWHLGRITEAAEHLDAAAAHAEEIVPGSLTPLLSDLDQLRIAVPFSVYIHDLIGDLDDPEARYDEAIAIVPGDPFWELLVSNFAAQSALSVGDLERTIRAGERGIGADPEGMSAFWSMAMRCALGAATCARGDIDAGLKIFDEPYAAYRAAGLRTNGATWMACRAHGFALNGRVEEAEDALAAGWNEIKTYQDLYAESTVLIAEALIARARDNDPTDILRRAFDIATKQGGHAMAARVIREAEALGISF